MTSGYVVAGYGITVGALGLYAVWVLRRGRALLRSLPDAPADSFNRTWSEGDHLLGNESGNSAPEPGPGPSSG